MILTALLILLLAAAILAIAWLFIRRRYLLPTPADEIQFARTIDGWELALYRYRPSQPIREREPIILCHGMLSNRFNVDLNEEVSLARFLRDRGFDAWVMELRGHGGSRRAEPQGPGGLSARVRRAGPFDWNVDDYILRDVPAVVEHVRRATDSERVHWFGHSMGGMILYGACAAAGMGPAIKSAVLSDAPASFAPLRTRVRLARAYGRLFPAVPPVLVVPFLGPVAWLLPEVMGSRYGIADRTLIMSLLANAIIPWGSSRALLQFCDMLESGHFRSVDASLDYEQGAARVDFPLLVLSAARKLMDEAAIRCGFERAPASDKRYLQFSREGGYSLDYTHSNLLIASESPREVFPEIAAWFASHSSA